MRHLNKNFSGLLEEAQREIQSVRQFADLVLAAFFGAEKAKEKEQKRDIYADLLIQQHGNNGGFLLENIRSPIEPFHWEIEFPEVFERENPGFDAIIGNPPFAGKNTIAERQCRLAIWTGSSRCTLKATATPILLPISFDAPSICCVKEEHLVSSPQIRLVKVIRDQQVFVGYARTAAQSTVSGRRIRMAWRRCGSGEFSPYSQGNI